ncbi:MAG TPA: TetR/AcrR family transcriptional regulator [Gammaproteobacteria bacterium]|jgi:AcrR family transcriptional regulator|nr:TetR/AcrR family transcriptional regulator [Gammaproteobacteria bacterium]
MLKTAELPGRNAAIVRDLLQADEVRSSTRSHITAVARQCFLRWGIEDTSLSDVARAAGLPLAELRDHFSDKLSLLTAVFDQCWDVLNARLVDVAATSLSARDALLSMLGVVLRSMVRDRDLAQIMLLESHRKEAASSHGYRQFIGFCGELSARGREDGSFISNCRPESIASQLIRAAESVMQYRRVAAQGGEPPLSPSAELALAFDMLTTGLRA